MTIRTLECGKCGDAQVFDSWPDDSDEQLDAYIRQEAWTERDGLDICPECGDRS